LARARSIEPTAATREPLTFMIAVLAHHEARAATEEVRAAAERVGAGATERKSAQLFPLLDLDAAVEPLVAAIEPAVEALARLAPGPLAEAGVALAGAASDERTTLVGAWLEDSALAPPTSALWIRVGAAPVLELAAARVEPPESHQWAGRACPLCGDHPQCAVIVEESGGWLQGSPRYLVCARCGGWWAFPRAVCPSCGEDDSRLITAYVEEDLPWVRIDSCDVCRGYIKTFDLREKGALGVIPVVDDVATLTMDVWAHEQGLSRPVSSLAGV
jgi:formate dehydrogenase accessory protein FdhE